MPMRWTLAMAAGLPHALNWSWGWAMVLAAFITGAALGIRFRDEAFWGGYASLRRRLTRLGHIALAALGMMNVLFSLSPLPTPGTFYSRVAAVSFAAGGAAMPAVCFLAAWKPAFARLFFLPVLLLIAAVAAVLIGGAS